MTLFNESTKTEIWGHDHWSEMLVYKVSEETIWESPGGTELLELALVVVDSVWNKSMRT